MENNSSPDPPAAPDGEHRPLPEPRLSRRAAWVAMGSVALALGLLWAASDMTESSADQQGVRAIEGLDDQADEEAVGKAARLDFTLKDMDGVDVNLASFKGKIILLNFWATWCGPCKVEIPDLVAVQNEYPDDLVILGVSVDDTPDKMKPYAEQYKINYPLLVGNGRDDVQDAYGPLWGIPVSVFIDREGKVAKKHSGIATREQILS